MNQDEKLKTSGGYMKKLLAVLCGAMLVVSVFAGSLEVIPLWVSQNMLIGTTNYFTPPIDLSEFEPDKTVFSFQYSVTNVVSTQLCGIVTFQHEVSNDGIVFLAPSNIVADVSHTNSMDSAGHGIYEFTPVQSRYIRFRAILSQTNAYVGAHLQLR
jgi:hypothetical protein